MKAINWTHPSVVHMMEQHTADDPVHWVERRARDLALRAMEEGWSGPPYDSFELAELLGIEVVARQELDDARLVAAHDTPRIEFNPQRRPERIRFSIAHEIGHFLFDDYSEEARYRDIDKRRDDDWQLEVLCNVAAAEMLMPVGALPRQETDDLNLDRLLGIRKRLGVSTEALLRRVVRLTDKPAALFAAARESDAPISFRIDYVVPSHAWRPPIHASDRLRNQTVLERCTAVGYSDHGTATWNRQALHVQAVGVPPYPGDSFPRIVGLLQPASHESKRDKGIRYVRGDAADPRGGGRRIIAHVVNNQARRWGGHGFVRSLMVRYPQAKDQYAALPDSERKFGAVHLVAVSLDTWIASMVAQAGYGPTPPGKPRLRLTALRQAFESLASYANELEASVHMPLVGTGQGGMAWPKVRDIVIEELVGRHVPVTVYVLPDAAMPEEVSQDDQLALM